MDFEIGLAQHLYRAVLVIGAVAGILLLLYLVIISSCYFCPCCLVYGKPRTLFGGVPGFYRTTLTQPTSITTSVLNANPHTGSSTSGGNSTLPNNDWATLVSGSSDATNNNRSQHNLDRLAVPVERAGMFPAPQIPDPLLQYLAARNLSTTTTLPAYLPNYFPNYPSLPPSFYSNQNQTGYFDAGQIRPYYGQFHGSESDWNRRDTRRHHSMQINPNHIPPQVQQRQYSLQYNPNYVHQYQLPNDMGPAFLLQGDNVNPSTQGSPPEQDKLGARRNITIPKLSLSNTFSSSRGADNRPEPILNEIQFDKNRLQPVMNRSLSVASLNSNSFQSLASPTGTIREPGHSRSQTPTLAGTKLSKFENIAASMLALSNVKGGYDSELLEVCPSDSVYLRRGSVVCDLLYGPPGSTSKNHELVSSNAQSTGTKPNKKIETPLQMFQKEEYTASPKRLSTSFSLPLISVSEDSNTKGRGLKVSDSYSSTSSSSSNCSFATKSPPPKKSYMTVPVTRAETHEIVL